MQPALWALDNADTVALCLDGVKHFTQLLPPPPPPPPLLLLLLAVSQVAGESEVKAQIKLRLRTSTQMPFVVVRSFQVILHVLVTTCCRHMQCKWHMQAILCGEACAPTACRCLRGQVLSGEAQPWRVTSLCRQNQHHSAGTLNITLQANSSNSSNSTLCACLYEGIIVCLLAACRVT
jgi:hypothetical protein